MDIYQDQDAQATVWDLYGTIFYELISLNSIKLHFLNFLDSYRFTEEEEEEREEGEEPSFEEKVESTVSKLTSLGRSLSSIEIAPLWAEMVGVIWPRDPLQRVEVEDGLRFKLEWKMIWSDDNQFTKVNCVACNPQDRVHII